MKPFILASLLAVTAVSGTVMISDPAKADYNYFSNGMFGHTYSPLPVYNPVLPLAGGAPAAPQAAGLDGTDEGGSTDNAAEPVQALLGEGCDKD